MTARTLLVATLSLVGASLAAQTAAPAAPPITPREPIILYHSKTHHSLSHFHTWTNKHGRDSDPDRVFTLVDAIDGAPAIRISGQHYGGIVTRDSYTNYRLLVEFRWGLSTWAPRRAAARDSGILFHLSGALGNNNKNMRGAWTRSVEFQILEGGTGDIWLVNGWDDPNGTPTSPRLTINVKPGQRVWDPAGQPTEFALGRIAWGGIDPDWKPTLGFRGRHDVEKPLGEWNHLELIAEGGDVTYFVNGVKVNEGRNGTYTAGPLLFQSEGAEIFYRRLELHPLKK